MAAKTYSEKRIEVTRRMRGWIIGALGLALLPHVVRLPLWIPAAFFVTAALHLRPGRPQQHVLPRMAVSVLVVAASLGIALQFGTLVGQESGLALLVAMLIIKTFDLRKPRDIMILVYMTYFLVVANFIFTQSAQIAVYIVLVLIVTTGTLLEVTAPSTRRTNGRTLRTASTIILQALPIMIIMFLFFPRLPTRFWALPESLRQGVTGLSSSMEPGALSSIAQSEAPAFRVSFDDAIPPPEDRYWRGPVFWYTDGRQWSGGPTWQQQAVHRRPSRDEFEVNYEGERIAHTVTLEPHHNRRLLALDVPLRMDRRSYVANDVQWLSPTPINKRARYDAVSLTGAAIQSPHIRERRRALQLPHNIPRRVRELARGWRNQTSDPAELLELARGYYREQDFVYTLNPPRMPRNPTETFLFEAKQGFCEHFASSFALLMRLAGVPTRIVTGYMGGELNPIGNYMVVRQSDAHAWCEVWLPEQGWIRVDPTTESAPERLAGSLLSGAGSGEEGFQFNPFRGAFFRQVEYIFDVINNEWNQWVVGYDFDTQTDLLSRAGIPQPSWRNMMFGFLLVSVLTLALVVTILALRADRPSDITVRAYDRFCRKMARAGFRRKPSEGPSDFARRVVAGRPDLKAEITAITETYIKLRYGTPDTLDQRALLRKVRTFNPGRMSSSQKD